jgi:hypothetical protein
VVPSHYSLDSLLQQGAFYPSSSTFIQLFQAFPAVASDSVSSVHGNPSRNVDVEIRERPDDGDANDAAKMGSKIDSLYLPYVSATEFHVFSSDGDNADDGDIRREERLQYLRRFTLTTGASRYDKIAGADVLRSINTNTADSAGVEGKDGDNNGMQRILIILRRKILFCVGVSNDFSRELAQLARFCGLPGGLSCMQIHNSGVAIAGYFPGSYSGTRYGESNHNFFYFRF